MMRLVLKESLREEVMTTAKKAVSDSILIRYKLSLHDEMVIEKAVDAAIEKLCERLA